MNNSASLLFGTRVSIILVLVYLLYSVLRIGTEVDVEDIGEDADADTKVK